MWRWLLIVAFGAAFLSPRGWAQRGARFSSGVGAHTGLAAPGIGRGFPGSARLARPPFGAGPRASVRFTSGFPRRPPYYPCLGRPCSVYPWRVAGWGWYYPGWYGGWYYDGSDWAGNESSSGSDEMGQIVREQQSEIDQLHQEVADLRAAQEVRASSPEPAREAESQPTEFVFRDGHSEEIQNYAIMGDMLWLLTSAGAKKIPLSALDFAATKKANDTRGVEFKTPR